MSFFSKNKVAINVFFVCSTLLDIIIAFFVNLISNQDFNIFDTHNIILCIILVLLIVLYIISQFIIRGGEKRLKNKRLQKAFQEHGGYETAAEEMKACLVSRDFKSFKDLKKMIEFLEK